VEESYR